MSIYFAQCEKSGLVKIGTSEFVKARIKFIEKETNKKLNILRLIDGGRSKEYRIHKMFSELREYGEWFRYDERFMTFVDDDIPEIISDSIKIKKPKVVISEKMSYDAIFMVYEIESAEHRIRASGRTITQWCKEHKIQRSSWERWARGTVPRADTWERVRGEIDRLPLIIEQDQAAMVNGDDA